MFYMFVTIQIVLFFSALGKLDIYKCEALLHIQDVLFVTSTTKGRSLVCVHTRNNTCNTNQKGYVDCVQRIVLLKNKIVQFGDMSQKLRKEESVQIGKGLQLQDTTQKGYFGCVQRFMRSKPKSSYFRDMFKKLHKEESAYIGKGLQ